MKCALTDVDLHVLGLQPPPHRAICLCTSSLATAQKASTLFFDRAVPCDKHRPLQRAS